MARKKKAVEQEVAAAPAEEAEAAVEEE